MSDLWLGWLMATAAATMFAGMAYGLLFTRKGRADVFRAGNRLSGALLVASTIVGLYFFGSVALLPLLEGRGIKWPFHWWTLLLAAALLALSMRFERR